MSTHQLAIRTVNAAADRQFNIAKQVAKSNVRNKALAEYLERLLVASVLPFPLLFVNPYLYLAIVIGCYMEHR